MKIREQYTMAKNNIRGRRKTGRMLRVMFFLALFIYFIICSMAQAIEDAVRLAKETPPARTVVFRDEDGTLYEQLTELCADMEQVTEVYPYVYVIAAETDAFREDNADIELKSCADSYADYLVEGELPDAGEILMPQYLYAAADGGYTDGSAYIGRTLDMTVTDWNGEETTVYYRVSGTYDNIYVANGSETAFLCPEDAVSLYDITCIGYEEALERAKERDGYNENIKYDGYEPQYYYAVVLDSRENFETVEQAVRSKTGCSGFPECDTDGGIIQGVFPFVRVIGTGITLVLLTAVIVMLVIMIGNDIRGRRKEMAMYLVQGYTGKQLLQILGMEYVVRFVPVLFGSVVMAVTVLAAGNYAVRNLLSVEFRIMKLGFAGAALGTGIVITGIVLGVAVYTIAGQLKRIELLKEIKAEG